MTTTAGSLTLRTRAVRAHTRRARPRRERGQRPRGQRPRTRIALRRTRARRHRERGQVSLLILGFTVVALLLVIGAVDVTSVQLARTQLMDAADGAALDAADSIDLPGAYSGGLHGTVRLDDGTVAASAAGYLARQPLPRGLTAWSLGGGTGSPDGRTAVVHLHATAGIPLVGPVLRSFGGSVGLDVESRARAVVQ